MKIAVVPYRDRKVQFSVLLPILKAHFDRIIVVEPVEHEPFDRGWVKNVGFQLSFAGPYDSVYFHDVDTVPISDHWKYPDVPRGCVMHLYGHRHCLGGIVGVDPAVFDFVCGFSHSDSWGGEDRHFQERLLQHNITVDRSLFEERFFTAKVVEINEKGVPESVEAIKNALQRKWEQYSPQKNEVVNAKYSIEKLISDEPRVRHYIVQKIRKSD